MLSEVARGLLIKKTRELVDYTYESYDSGVKLLRYFEGHDWKNPLILFNFMPANRQKSQSVGNLIGEASPHGTYKEFGYCQPEQCTIRCYAGKHHDGRDLNGRLLAYHFAEKTLEFVLKIWDYLLFQYSASLDEADDIRIRDVSIYDERKGTQVYIYELSFNILTQFRWDNKPYGEDDPEEFLLNEIGSINYEEEAGKTAYGIETDNIGV